MINSLIKTKVPFVIAEAGVNHNGSIKIAKKLVDIAVKAKADAIKFQTFNTEKLILKSAPKAKYHKKTTGSDKKLSWYNLLKSQEMDIGMHKKLINYCKKKKIIFLSTPYDEESSDVLEKLKVKIFKVASTDNNNSFLLKHLARKNKLMIISTGMMTMSELEDSLKLLKKHNSKIILMHCTSSYPCESKDANINLIEQYIKKFPFKVGFSDHTLGSTASILALAKGARIFEKHFTLSKKMKGPDHIMSLDPNELKNYVNDLKNAYKMLGSKNKKVFNSENENYNKLKKKIVTKFFLSKNTKIKRNMLTAKRANGGISVSSLKFFIGKHTRLNLKPNIVLKKTHLK